jgi:hypothetical protein
MKNDIIAIGGIRDRRYHYPKGFIDKRTKKPKTGFMKTAQGARLFVESNLKQITNGDVKFENLTPREKQVYKALTSDRAVNTYKFDGKKYYDPTGVIRNTLNQIKTLPENITDLTNFLTKENFNNLFQSFTPANKIDKFNTSILQFNKGAKKERYRTNRGDLLDVSSQLKKLEKQGYAITVDGQSGRDAIIFLKKWENEAVDNKIKDSRLDYQTGDPIKVQVLHKINIDPLSKEIFINTNETKVIEYYPQELLDKIAQGKLDRQNGKTKIKKPKK